MMFRLTALVAQIAERLLAYPGDPWNTRQRHRMPSRIDATPTVGAVDRATLKKRIMDP